MSARIHVLDPTIASPNGKTPEADLPVFVPTRQSFFRRVFKWENLTVSGREVKGFVISPGIAAVLLAALLGIVGWAYKSNTAESRETLIAITRMETKLDERTSRFNDEQAKLEAQLKEEIRLADLQRENQKQRQWEMEQALKSKGITLSQ